MRTTKFLILFVLLCFKLSNAQESTQQSLQGKWTLIALDAMQSEGFYLDLANNSYEISDEYKKMITPENESNVKAAITEFTKRFKDNFVLFEQNNIHRVIAGDENKGTFIIKNNNDKSFLNINYNNNIKDSLEFFIKDERLHIIIDNEADFIFTK